MTIAKTIDYVLKYGPYVVIAIIVLWAISKIKALFANKPDPTDTSKVSVDAISVDTTKLSLTEVELMLKADQLYEAMNGVGTDFSGATGIMSVLGSLNNKSDLEMVIKDFGVHPYILSGSQGAILDFLFGTSLNLVGWLTNECSDSQLTKINAEFTRLGSNILNYK